MTDQTEAPERIWRAKPWNASGHQHGLASWPKPEQAGEGATEYVRADLLDRVKAEARREERERIATALNDEADMRPCAEDADVIRGCADLVRADFSYDEAERLAIRAEAEREKG